MLFRIDEQTLKDLNVFDASDGTPLIKLFSSVKTSGGKHKLQEMMKSPLIDIELLTQRKDAIKYFHDHNFALGLEQINFELIEIYLSNRDERPKVNLIDSFLYYVKHRATSNYYIKFSGIKNTALFCAFLKNLINGRLSNKLPSKLNCIYEEIETILKQEVFLKLLNLSPAKVRFNQLASLDLNLRFKDRDKLMRLLQIAYELDVYQNVALLAKNRGFGFATYIASPSVKLEFDGIFHPKIDNPVKNNLSLREEKNIIFLSGSNMTGKSSFLKSLGLCIYLSQIGFPVPANSMITSVFEGLITTINLSDNIESGYSHFFSEVQRIKLLAESLIESEKMVVILDELFRGTNVKDAFDASLAVISALSTIKNSFFLISTHIVELVPELKKHENISFMHLETVFRNDQPEFTYQLKEGVSKEKVGMFIIKKEGIIDIIEIAAAKQKSKKDVSSN